MAQEGHSGNAAPSGRTSRRDLLKRALIVLGAAAIVQPRGGVAELFAQGDSSAKKKKGPKAGGGTGSGTGTGTGKKKQQKKGKKK